MVNRVAMVCLILQDQIPHSSIGRLLGEGQHMIVLEGNDFPYDGCNAIWAAKTQRNILREHFMNEGQVPGPMNSS